MANTYDTDVSKLDALLDSFKTPNTEQSLGWAAAIPNEDEASKMLYRSDVLSDMRNFYKERDGFSGTDEDLRNKFFEDRTWRNVNTVSMGRGVADAYSMTPEQTARLARPYRDWETDVIS